MNTADCDALETRAHQAWERGDHKAAFHMYSTLAERGVSSAWVNLGYFYDCGIGVRRNRDRALYWYKRAYRSQSGAAASNIATIYRDEGKHRLEAQWYKRAYQLNDGDAAVELAKLYLSGKGVRRSARTAAAYLRRAIASSCITEEGREEAQAIMDDAARRPGDRAERRRKAAVSRSRSRARVSLSRGRR